MKDLGRPKLFLLTLLALYLSLFRPSTQKKHGQKLGDKEGETNIVRRRRRNRTYIAKDFGTYEARLHIDEASVQNA